MLNKRFVKNKIIQTIIKTSAWLAISLLALILIFLLKQALPIFYKPQVELQSLPKKAQLFKAANLNQAIALKSARSFLLLDNRTQLEQLYINGHKRVKERTYIIANIKTNPIEKIIVSITSNSFWVLQAQGDLSLFFPQQEKAVFTYKLPNLNLAQLEIFYLKDKLYLFNKTTKKTYLLNTYYPELNFKSLIEKVNYPGYTKAQYLWQPPDIQEPLNGKYSLIPLVFGSIKAAGAALIIALPLGLLSAIYVGFFMHGRARERVKITIELLAALPSVIIGFLAIVILAPMLDKYIFSIYLPDLNYQQQNTIIVAISLGIAVIPTVFTLAEEAIYAVPQRLINDALMLGATKWQALTKVVLLTATPGVFSAAMLGFGRAIGETMIVLMVSGNAALIDWSPLVGMRTLAATIALESSDALVGSAHFRVLFLAAIVLFLMTLIINSIVEVIRQRLRKKYSLL